MLVRSGRMFAASARRALRAVPSLATVPLALQVHIVMLVPVTAQCAPRECTVSLGPPIAPFAQQGLGVARGPVAAQDVQLARPSFGLRVPATCAQQACTASAVQVFARCA